jgi:hypothetical protein
MTSLTVGLLTCGALIHRHHLSASGHRQNKSAQPAKDFPEICLSA